MSQVSRRVVVTGIGILSPLGNSVSQTWKALSQGQSGIGPITRFDASKFLSHIAGELKEFNSDQVLSPKDTKRMDPVIQYGVIAAHEAIQDSGLNILEDTPERIGTLIGSGIGGIQSIERTCRTYFEKGARGISPFFIPQAICNLISGYVSIKYGAKGPNTCVVTACSTGAHAIGDSFRMIQHGTADVMICGGSEAAICELGVGGFSAMRALSTRNHEPQKASRPFDKDRDGFVMAEGSGILILEEYERAKKRGAKLYAEVIGYGLNADAFHITNPSPNGEGAARCMTLALEDAQLSCDVIDYINAHGTSTDAGDIAETNAIKTVFKEGAKKVSISSTKSMTGHMLGAAGSSEAIFSILALNHQVIPPTINLDNPDPLCDLDYTPHEAREKKCEVVMSNSFGFGGTNGVLIFRKIA